MLWTGKTTLEVLKLSQECCVHSAQESDTQIYQEILHTESLQLKLQQQLPLPWEEAVSAQISWAQL